MGADGAEEIFIDLIHYPVLSLGIGKRLGVWFQGCSIRCEDCISSHTWMRTDSGRTTVSSVMEKIMRFEISDRKGVTISGGEPFDQPDGLKRLLFQLRIAGFRDIMVYSGHEFSYLSERFASVLEFIDVLITGKFIRGSETDYLWKGSDNQEMVMLSKDPDIQGKYLIYRDIRRKRSLQVIEANGGLYIIGIPSQKDAKVIKDGFC